MARLRAIDIHVHPADAKSQRDLFGPDADSFYRYFGRAIPDVSADELAELYDSRDMAAVLFAMDASTATGRRGNTNEDVAETVRQWPHIFAGFASVDPWKGRLALDELRYAVTQLGLCGLKLHPIVQEFFPDDRRFYPLWGAAQELGIPVLFHTGQAAWGAGKPGGGGAKLKFSKPIPHMDDVAADFPDITVVLAHPSFPWQDEALAMAVHKTNVYIDLSGWSPKHFPANLVTYARSLLSRKCLFGSDYPAIHPDDWVREFEMLDFSADAKRRIYLENALDVLSHPNARPLTDRVHEALTDRPLH
jgi:predicted TIM-barrel fold metal-dependent hydrolase